MYCQARFVLPQAAVLAAAGLAAWMLIGKPPALVAINEDEIEITQSGGRVLITVDNPDGDELSWQIAQLTDIAGCGSGAAFMGVADEDVASGRTVVNLTIESSKLAICLKVSNPADDSTAFKAFQPSPLRDSSAPVISIRKINSSTLQISSQAPDLDATSWVYGRFEQKPNCRAASISIGLPEKSSNNLALSEADNDSWYCFSVMDINGNSSFRRYGVEGVDTSAPELTIRQDGRLLSAESEEEVSGWTYVFSPSQIACNDETFLNNRSARSGNQVTLTNNRINYYYCFKASDAAGNDGFVPHRVASVDFATPKVRLAQDGLLLVAKSDRPLDSWHYVKADAEFDCNENTNFEEAVDFSSSASIDLTPADHLNFFCVRGTNRTNTASFASIEIVIEAIKVRLSLADDTLTASADGEDLEWAYFKNEQEPDCDQGDRQQLDTPTDFDSSYRGSAANLNKLDNDFWFCFRAVDAFGNAGYAKRQISGITALPPGGREATTSGRLDVILITLTSLAGGAGFIVWMVLKKRRQLLEVAPKAPAPTKKARPKRRPAKTKPAPGKQDDGMTQPLDYLKGDDDSD